MKYFISKALTDQEIFYYEITGLYCYKLVISRDGVFCSDDYKKIYNNYSLITDSKIEFNLQEKIDFKEIYNVGKRVFKINDLMTDKNKLKQNRKENYEKYKNRLIFKRKDNYFVKKLKEKYLER